MNRGFFGDSHDIVKQSLVFSLRKRGPWSTHPMFTEAIPRNPSFVKAYGEFLDTPLLSDEILTPRTDRDAFFASARTCRHHVFIDPDTGLGPKSFGGKKAPSYLFVPELACIAQARPKKLTLIFDQALARGIEEEQLKDKLRGLSDIGLHALAYRSHACFILVSRDPEVMNKAYRSILAGLRLTESQLPRCRFLVSDGWLHRGRRADSSVCRASES